MKKNLFFLLLLFTIGLLSAQFGEQHVLWQEDWESTTDDWNFVVGTLTNQWFLGEAAVPENGGTKAVYVSNDEGVTNAWTTGAGTASIVHFWRYVEFPSNAADIEISFDFRNGVPGPTATQPHHFRVWMTNLSDTAVNAGTQMNATNSIAPAAPYNTQHAFGARPDWQRISINYTPTQNVAMAGTTRRLVFTWTNTVATTATQIGQPPPAIDNIKVSYMIYPLYPIPVILFWPQDNELVSLTPSFEWNNSPDGALPTGYKILLGTSPTTMTQVASLDHITGTPPTTRGLQRYTHQTSLLPNTQYYWQIIPFNDDGDVSDHPIRSFTTLNNNEIRIGYGQTLDVNTPIATNSSYFYSQTLFFQEEINTQEQQIYRISYYWNAINGTASLNWKNWEIYMAHTDLTTLAVGPYVSNLVKVFDGDVIIPATPGWFEIVLDSPFPYNNEQNLIVGVNIKGPGPALSEIEANNFGRTLGTNISVADGGVNRTLRSATNATIPFDVNNLPNAANTVPSHPNIIFGFQALPDNPVFSVSPESKNFGVVNPTSQSLQTFVITNIGGTDLIIEELLLDGPDTLDFVLEEINTPYMLASGSSLNVNVAFRPLSQGFKIAHFVIKDNISRATRIVSLSGIGNDDFVSSFPLYETFSSLTVASSHPTGWNRWS